MAWHSEIYYENEWSLRCQKVCQAGDEELSVNHGWLVNRTLPTEVKRAKLFREKKRFVCYLEIFCYFIILTLKMVP